jgi:hypothetical protein
MALDCFGLPASLLVRRQHIGCRCLSMVTTWPCHQGRSCAAGIAVSKRSVTAKTRFLWPHWNDYDSSFGHYTLVRPMDRLIVAADIRFAEFDPAVLDARRPDNRGLANKTMEPTQKSARLIVKPLGWTRTPRDRLDFGKFDSYGTRFHHLSSLFVYPAISLLIVLVVVPLVWPLIVSRNKIFCSALGTRRCSARYWPDRVRLACRNNS